MNHEDLTGPARLNVDLITPHTYKSLRLKMPKYRKAKGSFGWGVIQGIRQRWVLFLIIGVVALILILYMTGYLKLGG